MFLLSSADLFPNIFSNELRNTIRMSHVLEPQQDRHSVGPDLGPNFLQQTIKVAANKERVNLSYRHLFGVGKIQYFKGVSGTVNGVLHTVNGVLHTISIFT